jgi:uncharacterized Zn-binding protein involved in type VI secretion
MSAPVARKGDATSGHGPFPTRPIAEGSPNVYVNGIPIARVTDKMEIHCAGKPCHELAISVGSSTVFSNGLAVAYLGSEVDCGEFIVTGSPNVFVKP